LVPDQRIKGNRGCGGEVRLSTLPDTVKASESIVGFWWHTVRDLRSPRHGQGPSEVDSARSGPCLSAGRVGPCAAPGAAAAAAAEFLGG